MASRDVPDKLTEGAAFLSCLIWETLGWTHCPRANLLKIPHSTNIKAPRCHRISEKYNLTFQKSLEPKLLLPINRWQEELPKAVVLENLRREFSRIDQKKAIEDLKIDPSHLRPRTVYFKNSVTVLQQKYDAGLPVFPYLDLELFDNEFLEIRSPENWLSTGSKGNIKKPVPALAYIPEKYRTKNKVKFLWQEVVVLSYSAEKNKFLVRRKCDCPQQNDKIQITLKTLETLPVDEFTDIYLPRIYISFLSEDPLLYAQRLASAVNNRHKVEESLRFTFYIDCMPLNNVLYAPSSFIDRIRALATNYIPEDDLSDYEKERINKYIDEIQLIYRRSINSNIYQAVTHQRPCLWDNIPEGCMKPTVPRLGYKMRVAYSLESKYKSFERNSYFCKEIVKALLGVQKQMLVLLDKQLYSIPLPNVLPMDEFIAIQKTSMQRIKRFVHNEWIEAVTDTIKDELWHFKKGHYNLHGEDWNVYEQSKLKRFMTFVALKMQDTTRTLISSGLKAYADLIKDACHNLMNLPEMYTWTEGFDTTARAPLKKPLFQIEAVLKGDELRFSSDLLIYRTFIIDLFNDALDVTTDIPHPEVYVMENMLLDQDRKLETVNYYEPEVEAWRHLVVTGMDKALVAMMAYCRSYTAALSGLDVDPINYVKNFARQKIQYDKLRNRIEYHMIEKKHLSEKIPESIDIGPFHLITKSVKVVVIKKHETLADALLQYFSTKLKEYMGDIMHEFTTLQNQVQQLAGNIETLLEQIKWFEDVPGTIEKLSISVKQLREDYKLLSEFYRGFEDNEFSSYWEIIGMPYSTTVILNERVDGLENEKKYLRTLLDQDQNNLVTTMETLAIKVDEITKFRDIQKSIEFQRDIRHTRRTLTRCLEQAKVYNLREGLFEIPVTNYGQIQDFSNEMEPYEVLWSSIADFYKWRERDISDMGAEIDQNELFNVIEESYSKLFTCLKLFKEKVDIVGILLTVRGDMDEYRSERFKIEIPKHDEEFQEN